ncbi:MAG TPA: hypothetical protein VMV69_04045 [Pirellulales bacterium]|nr:hypothetical protein [Pirellulales bacterium]
MPDERSSKSLSERVEITFHQRPNRARQLRWRWSLAALALVLLVPAVAAFRGDRRPYQANPVSQAHQLIANDCAKCHDGSWQPLARLLHFDDRRVSTSDEACGVCHAGPIHHKNQPGPPAHCAECHREHRGQAPLARVDDAACVHCHRDLKTADGSQPSFVPVIDDFAGHPEFAVQRESGEAPGRGHRVREAARPKTGGGWEDKATIRFNHHKHLPQGGVLRLDGTHQELSCEACHQTDRASGYMLPIKHDQHCAECHENEGNFDYLRGIDALGPGGGAPTQKRRREGQRAHVAHGSVAQVHAKLIEFYTNYLKSPPVGAPPPSGDAVVREIPGRGPPLTEEGWAWVRGRLDDAERLLLGNQQQHGCRYCHTAVSKNDGGWEVEPPNIPVRWLKHGKFRHDSHALLSCTECHVRVDESSDTSDVLLPGIATCRKCHSASPVAGAVGVARTDCAECHNYHNRAGKPFHGRLSLQLREVESDQARRPPDQGSEP